MDSTSIINPNAFKYIEGLGYDSKTKSIHSSIGPPIDTRSYVDTEAFRHLEGQQSNTQYNGYYDRDGIDERSFVPSNAFQHLEFTDQRNYPYEIDYSSYGVTDV
jgi:hypothetical protein